MDIEEDLIAEEEYFWKENVEKSVEPPYTEKPDPLVFIIDWGRLIRPFALTIIIGGLALKDAFRGLTQRNRILCWKASGSTVDLPTRMRNW